MTKTLDQRVKMAMRGSRAHKERLMTDEDIDALYGFIEAEIVDAMKESAKIEREAISQKAEAKAKEIEPDDHDREYVENDREGFNADLQTARVLREFAQEIRDRS